MKTLKYKLLLTILLVVNQAIGQNWSGVSGFDNRIRFLGTSDSGDLLIAGRFKYVDNLLANGIISFGENGFDTFGLGETGCANVCGPLLAIVEYDGNLYAGGHITEMGGVSTEGIAKWDEQEWTALSSGVNGYVGGLEVINNLLYVGGAYDSVADMAANGIAVWDGVNWQTVGDLPNAWDGEVAYMNIGSIKEYQTEVYIAGLFPEGMGLSHSIARWNGSQWNTVGESILGVDVWINDMEIFNGELYVAGYFFREHGNLSSGILRWNGNNWHGVGDGVEFGAQVFDLQVHNDFLYASGNFASISGISASRIAKWNGEQWCGLGSTFNNSINSMAVYRDTLYVSCGTEVDGIQVNYLAKWLGGDYVDTCVAVTGIEDMQGSNPNVSTHPNPTTSTTTLTWQGQSQTNHQLNIYDAQGRQVAPPVTYKTNGEWELDMSGLAPGIYFGRLEVGEEMRSFKVVRE